MFHRVLLFVLLCLAGSVATAQGSIPVQRVEIVRTYPHDPAIFTEGLFYRDGALYESSGLRGQSSLRRVRIEDGRTEIQTWLPGAVFGEGIVDWGDEIIGVTWRNGAGYRWDARTLSLRTGFDFDGEGWGLTRDGESLILSDGSPILHFLDPATFQERRRIRVTAGGKPVPLLNELEWVDGEIYANIWKTDRIARIDPVTGAVKAWIDLADVDRLGGGQDSEDVLNGIAWDAAGKRLFVTGKRWSKLFEIRLLPPGPVVQAVRSVKTR
ncbi:MAG: glutaminyl-peptide cyclotransferase [Sphingomonas sp.]|jgi:glutamine cyclotransferase|uniref:glutaminyl-peptide cyclotransferase n=1 Tax=Sphingomonas sp. TaxID=28214 RepID=UPI00356735BB